MSECSRILNSGWARTGATLLAFMFTAGVVWATLGAEVKSNSDRSVENERNVKNIQSKLNTLEGNQKVIQNQLQNDQDKSADFQRRTDSALGRILEKLENIQRDRDPR